MAPIEFEFDAGGDLTRLWAQYQANSQSITSVLSKVDFVVEFARLYCNRSGTRAREFKDLKTIRDELPPVPGDVILEFAQLFSAHFASAAGDKGASSERHLASAKTKSKEELAVDLHIHLFNQPQKAPASGKGAPVAPPQASPSTDAEIARKRANFLLITETLGFICFTRVNRDFIAMKLGPNFAQLLVETLHAFAKKTDEIITQWSEVSGTLGDKDYDIFVDSAFLLEACHLLTKLLFWSTPDCHSLAHKISANLLPRQPWSNEECRKFGFKKQFRAVSSVSDADTGSSLFNLTENIFPHSVEMLICADFDESWAKDLIHANAIKFLVLGLRKFNTLSLTLSRLYFDTSNQINSLRSVWSSCLIVEVDCLITLGSMLSSNPTLCHSRFHSCGGPEVISAVLSSKDAIGLNLRGFPTFIALIIERGIVCIRVSEIMKRASRATMGKFDIDIADIDVSLANLPGFMSFIHAFGYFLRFENVPESVENEAPPLDPDAGAVTYRIKCSSYDNVDAPMPNSDLWPYRDPTVVSKKGVIAPGDERIIELHSQTMALLEICAAKLNHPRGTLEPFAEYLPADYADPFKALKIIDAIVHERLPGGLFRMNEPSIVAKMGENIAKIWKYLFNVVFCIIFNIGAAGKSGKGYGDKVSCTNAVLTNVIAGTMSALGTDIRTESKRQLPPVLQTHFLWFLGRMLAVHPIETIAICRRCNAWGLLAQSSSFLKGGRTDIEGMTRIAVTNGLLRTTAMEDIAASTVEILISHPGTVPPEYSPPERVTAPPVPSDARKRPSLLGVTMGDEIDKAGEDIGRVNLNKNFDEIKAEEDDQQSAAGRTRAQSNFEGNDGELATIAEEDEMEDGAVVKKAAEVAATSVDPASSEQKPPSKDDSLHSTDAAVVRDNQFRMMSGYLWTVIHDAIFDVFSFAVLGLNSAPHDQASKQGPKTEIDNLLGSLSNSTPDVVTLRVLRFVTRLFGVAHDSSVLRQMRLEVDQLAHSCVNVMTKCLSVSKYQISAYSGVDGSSEKKNMTLLRNEDTEVSTTNERPFFFMMRHAVITLMLQLSQTSPEVCWNSLKMTDINAIKMYKPELKKPLAAKAPSPATNQGANAHIRKIQGKYFVLLQLLLIPSCRDGVMCLVIELMHYYATLVNSELNFSTGANDDSIDLLQSEMYTAFIHDITKWLFLHIRCAPQQPQWCNAPSLVCCIFEWLTSFFRGAGRIFYSKHYQLIFESYGNSTVLHSALSWQSSRSNIFREVFRSIDPCLQDGFGSIDMIRHALSFITAIMIGNDSAKEKFHSLMLLQKRKSKSRTETSSFSLAQFSYRTCNFHDLGDIIVGAEPKLSSATIQLIFDMLLDVYTSENKRDFVLTPDLEKMGLFRDTDVPLIANTIAIPILSSILPHCSSVLQLFVLNTLKNLIMGQNSSVNMSKCSQMQPPMLDILLDSFLDLHDDAKSVTTLLIRILGRHNISVSQLKRIFSLMQSSNIYRPPHTWQLLSALQGMITPVDGPRHYILFEGKESGLSSPPVAWPVKNAFSFSIWFSVESQYLDKDKIKSEATGAKQNNSFLNSRQNPYCPTLVSIRQASGEGFEIFLRQDSVNTNEFSVVIKIYKSKSENQSFEVEIDNIDPEDPHRRPVDERHWHYLGLSHADAAFRSAGELSVLLDSHYSKHRLHFPKFRETIPEICIGDCTESLRPHGINTTFRGRTGAIYFFSESLNEPQLRYIYHLGPGFANHFSQQDTPTSATDPYASMLDGTLNSSIMLALNPAVMQGNLFLDTTPPRNLVRFKKAKAATGKSTSAETGDEASSSNGNVNFFRHSGTYYCFTRDIRDALYCLGGFKVLLPLFSQFDQPLKLNDGSLSYHAEEKLCIGVLELLFALLRDVPASQKEVRLKGFELTGFFLERVSPKHMSLYVLDIIIALMSDPEWDDSWHAGVVEYLILNFKLWVYTPFHVQTKLFHFISSLMTTYPNQMRYYFQFQDCIDLINTMYSLSHAEAVTANTEDERSKMDEINERSAPQLFNEFSNIDEFDEDGVQKPYETDLSASPFKIWGELGYDAVHWVHPHSGEVVGKKLMGDDLDCVRNQLFELAHTLFISVASDMSQPIESYVQIILRSFKFAPSTRGVCQLIQFFMRILSSAGVSIGSGKVLGQRIISGLSSDCRVFPIIHLLQHPSGSVRILGFCLLNNVIQMVTAFGVLSGPTEVPLNSNLNTAEELFNSFWMSDLIESMDIPELETEQPLQKVSGTPKQTEGEVLPGLGVSKRPAGNLTLEEIFGQLRGDQSTDPDRKLNDSFEAIGVPYRLIEYLFLWAQGKLHQFISSEYHTGHCEHLNEYCKLVISCMHSTMMGIPSLSLFANFCDPKMFIPTDFVAGIDKFVKGKTGMQSTPGSLDWNTVLMEEVCIGSLMTPILRFVRHSVVSFSVRLAAIVNLKTTLHCFRNFEVLLGFPSWQMAMFQLIASEQKKCLKLESHLNTMMSRERDLSQKDEIERDTIAKIILIKDISRSNGITETIQRILSDVLLHAMQHGICRVVPGANRPSYAYRLLGLAGPDEQGSSELEFPEMLQQIIAGKRVLGILLLRNYMGHMRYFAQQGELDATRFGIQFLQQIVLMTHREITGLKGSQGDALSKVQLRLIHINIWLLTSIIMEFISIPALRVSSSKADRSPVQYMQSELPDSDGQYATLTGVNLQAFNSSNSLDTEDVTSENVDEFPSERDSDISVDCIEIFEGVQRSRGDSIANDREVVGRVHGTMDDELTILQNDRKRELANKEQNDVLQSQWKLLDSMLELLEDCEIGLEVSNTSRSYRMGLALSLGLRSVLELSQQVHVTIDLIVNSSASIPKNVDFYEASQQLEYTSRNVCWTIARMLADFYVKGGLQRTRLWSVDVLPRLRAMMESLRVKDQSSTTEAAYIIMRLVNVLSSSASPRNSPWFRDGAILVARELSFIRKMVGALFYKTQSAGVQLSMSLRPRSDTASTPIRSSSNVGESSITPPRSTNSPSRTLSGNGSVDETPLSELPGVLANPNSPELSFEAATEMVSEAIQFSSSHASNGEVLLQIINSALEFSQEFTILSWEQWRFALSSIQEEGDRREDVAISSRLNEIGLHKHSQMIAREQSLRKKRASLFVRRINAYIDRIMEIGYRFEADRMRLLVKLSKATSKRQRNQWSIILRDLATERGVWGLGARRAGSQAFWKLSPVENEIKMHPTLVRNPFGSNHETATRLANPLTKSEAAALAAAIAAADDGGAKGFANSRKIGLELWKDLQKYRKESHLNAEADAQNGNEENEEGGVEGEANTSANQAISSSAGTSSGILSRRGYGITMQADKVVFSAKCEVINQGTNAGNAPSKGTLSMTKTSLVFQVAIEDLPPAATGVVARGNTEHLWACRRFVSTEWRLEEIVNVFQRTYQLRNVAVELFLDSRVSIFISLLDERVCRRFEKIISQYIKSYRFLPAAALVRLRTTPSSEMGSRSSVMDVMLRNLANSWRQRDISNFDYLMYLNTLAGRSYNDLGQYPVFPWVVADYRSPQLDLRDPSSFRDLKWPMGAQLPKQRESLMARYDELNMMYQMSNDNDDGYKMPPFNYGSHYSAAAFVLWFLIRLEPYTSLHIQLQEGKFDKADRLFDSVDASWQGCIANPTDVKELVPEFYYCADMFENINEVDFGTTQTMKKIDKVVLPPWASDAQDFVMQNREALESEYVSQNLHHWIDLIFGYKQRPPHVPGGSNHAVEACNVFFHLTYGGAVDLDELLNNDKPLYDQYVKQIAEFGQTPVQLFTQPHIERLPLDAVDIIFPIASCIRGLDTIPRGGKSPIKPKRVLSYRSVSVSIWPIVLIWEVDDKIVTLDSSRLVGLHQWQSLPPDVVPPFKIKTDIAAYEIAQGVTSQGVFRMPYSSSNVYKNKRFGVPFASQAMKSQSQLSRREAVGEKAMMATIMPKRVLEKYERDARRQVRASDVTRRTTVDASASSPSFRSTVNPNPSSTSLSDTPVQESSSQLAASPSPSPSLSPSPSIPAFATSSSSMGSSTSSSSSYRPTRSMTTSSTSSSSSASKIVCLVRDDHIHSGLFAIHEESKLLFSCGHWDHTVRVTQLDSCRMIQSIEHHRDVVTCIALANDFSHTWLVTGSRDCTVVVWDVSPDSSLPVRATPLYTIYGHDDSITSVCVSTKLDIVVSGSDDGTLMIHSLRDGRYIRSIIVGPVEPPALAAAQPKTAVELVDNSIAAEGASGAEQATSTMRRRINWVGVNDEGFLVVYLMDDGLLCSYTVNGRHLASRTIKDKLHALILSKDGKVLLTGGNNGLVVLRWVHTLLLANTGSRRDLEAIFDGSSDESTATTSTPFNTPIRSLFLTQNERHLIVGLETGEIRVLAQDSDYLRQRLQKKLVEIGIL